MAWLDAILLTKLVVALMVFSIPILFVVVCIDLGKLFDCLEGAHNGRENPFTSSPEAQLMPQEGTVQKQHSPVRRLLGKLSKLSRVMSLPLFRDSKLAWQSIVDDLKIAARTVGLTCQPPESPVTPYQDPHYEPWNSRSRPERTVPVGSLRFSGGYTNGRSVAAKPSTPVNTDFNATTSSLVKIPPRFQVKGTSVDPHARCLVCGEVGCQVH